MGHAAHGQMLMDQKLNQLGVFPLNRVLFAKTPHLHRPQFGVVAAPAFGNIVKERRNVEDPRAIQASGQLRAKRVFVRMLGNKKAANVAQHHQNMLVHGVDVEQVVLHLPHDLAKHPQIAPQHRGLVHEPHGVGNPIGRHEDGAKGGAIHRIRAKLTVHQAACVVERAQGAGGQAFNAGRRLVNQKRLKNGVRLALVQIVTGDINHAALLIEAVVDTLWRAFAGIELFFNIEQQNLVQLGDGFGGPVIAAHERFAGPHRQALTVRCHGAVTEGFGHCGLQVEHEPVFAAVGNEVQARTNQVQQRFIALELADFKRCRQAVLGQGVPIATEPGRFGGPKNHLQVTQAARRLLAVGFQRVRGIFKLVVTLLHLQGFRDKERFRVQHRIKLRLKISVQRGIAGDQAGFNQGSLYRHIVGCFRQALADRANAGANLQSCIPATADEGLNFLFQNVIVFGRFVVGQQNQHIHIGMGEQLAAPKTTYRRQGQRTAQARLMPERFQGGVSQRRQLAQRRIDATRRGVGAGQGQQHPGFVGAVVGAQCNGIGHAQGFGRVGVESVGASACQGHKIRRRRAASRQGEHLVAGGRDQHGVLPLCRQ